MNQPRLVGLGVVVGVGAGASSALFLVTLDWVTEARIDHPWLLAGLPAAGFAIGLVYHLAGRGSAAGNNLILDEIHEPTEWIPRRMAPFVLVGTLVTHLFGGSAGREGTAIQMSGSLADWLNRAVGLSGTDRRIVLLAAIGGGFSAVFGVPVAGLVFALEVQAVGRLRWRALAPAAAASIVGHLTVLGLGVDHLPTPALDPQVLSPALVAKVVVASVAFGLAALVFAQSIHRLKAVLAHLVRWPPVRPLVGGLAVVALVVVVDTRDYLGLSLPLLSDALSGGAGVVAGAFALKLLFTVVTLGSGFQGGEVTPLFVIGATLGVTLGHALGTPIPLMAALGFVAVFAGATNTPVACTVMGVELFGWHGALLMVVACGVSYLCSGPGGIYGSQRHGGWGFHHITGARTT